MTPLFLYLLKVNIALVLFYLAYRYGLRRLTFYTLNRFFLLFAIGFSSVYPLIDVNAFLPGRNEPGGELIHYLPNLYGLAQESPLELWNVLTLVFWSGVIVMAVRFVLQCVSLARIHFTSVKQVPPIKQIPSPANDTSGQDLRIVSEKINPFSFFRNIYINPLLHSAEEQRTIIAHEQVHASEWHTADILAGELNRIFYWFNPGAWLMITAIRENLEFITDRRVLRAGTDAKAYQYSLVKVSHIPYASSLANNFNFSHLKIRITMMDKKPSSELHLVKYLVLVPFVAALALAFNVTRAAFTPPAIVKFTEPLIAPNDTLPEKAPDWETNEEIYKNGNFTGYAKTMASISGIDPEDPVILNGKLTNGRQALEAARRDGIGYAARLKNELAQYYIPGKDLLYWLETKNTGRAPNRPDLPPPPEAVPQRKEENVKEVRFSPAKDDQGSHHKESGENAVPRVTLRKIVTPFVEPDSATQKDPLILLDGVQIQTFDGISPDDIASISILKGGQATSLFGKKAEGGAMLITTKANSSQGSMNSSDPGLEGAAIGIIPGTKAGVINRLHDQDILFMIDDVEVTAEEVKVLAPETIKSISVFKDKPAIEKYGEKGKNGVIKITTKQQETGDQ